MSDDTSRQQDAHGASEGDELIRRQAALRALAQSATQQPASAPVTPTPSAPKVATTTRKASAPARGGFATLIAGERKAGRRRGVLVGVSLALLVAVVAVGIIGARAYLARRAATLPKPVLRLDPLGQSNFGCINDIAWSPDGSQIAALGGLQGNCGGASTDSPTDAVLIYSAASGKVITQLQPDPVVFDSAAFKQFAAANHEAGQQTTIGIQSLTWTHDQQALLMSYGVSVQFPEGQSGVVPSMAGILRLGIHNAALTKLWTDPAANTIVNGMWPYWDLVSGKLSALPPPPVATLYRWNSDGTISAAGSAAGKPVGSPSAGQTFSIWQPGVLGLAQSDIPGSPTAVAPQDVEWGAQFAALSPDGRYFYQYFPSAYGSLVPPSTHQLFPHEPRIEPHDAALVALAKRLAATPQTGRSSAQYLVAWRPDGRLLATVTQNYADSTALPKLTVSLYDTASGKLAKQLTPDFSGLQSGSAGIGLLVWSPDGKRLLLVDNIYGAITIWGPGALPA